MENTLLIFVVLFMVIIFMEVKTNLLYLSASAVAGGTGSLIQLYFMSNIKMGYIEYIIFVLITDIIMFKILFIKRTIIIKEYLMGIILFHGGTFTFIKLFEFVDKLAGIIWGLDNYIVIYGMTLFMLTSIFFLLLCCRYKISHKYNEDNIYHVSLIENGNNVDVLALLDTGNNLVDPFTNKPVSVIEKGTINKIIDKDNIMDKKPYKYKIIPFKSIGNEAGILEGIEIDEMIIWKRDIPLNKTNKIILKKVVIAVYDGKLSESMKYQMILNSNIFEKWC